MLKRIFWVIILCLAIVASFPQSSSALFNYWGIGKKGEDNGILFLISKKDKRVEIETGYGVEEILPDSLVGNIIDRQIIPYFKQDDFDDGTIVGTENIISILSDFPSPKTANLPQLEDITDGRSRI